MTTSGGGGLTPPTLFRSLWIAGERGSSDDCLAALGDFILKPKHSAFYATPLTLLLQNLGAHHLIICGVASDQCVMTSVADARMRDIDVVVPRDCVASQTPLRNAAALRQFAEVFKLKTPLGRRLSMPR